MPTVHEVVETRDVSAAALEKILDEWSQRGWRFETMPFAMRGSSRRARMAFLTVVRESDGRS